MESGELAALGTAVCWTLSSLAFEVAARRVGALSLNLARVVLALGWLTVFALIMHGRALPTDATAAQWGWLSLSGLVGIVIGDMCTFRAYIEIGARRTMVIATSVPIFAAGFAWALLGEAPTVAEVAGMAVIVSGVLLAVLQRATSAAETRSLMRGILLGLGGSLCQAGGFLLSKRGMEGYSAVPGTQIRMIAGIAGFALAVTAAGRWRRMAEAARDGVAMRATAVGALFGPGIGVALSLYAAAHAKAGIATCLNSLSTIFIIPFALARGERVGLGAYAGVVLAIGGVAILALA